MLVRGLVLVPGLALAMGLELEPKLLLSLLLADSLVLDARGAPSSYTRTDKHLPLAKRS